LLRRRLYRQRSDQENLTAIFRRLLRIAAPIMPKPPSIIAHEAGSGTADEGGLARVAAVLAAASLQESLTEAANAWTAKGHAKPILSFAASSALARQVIAGAPADLFLSADEEWMDAVAKAGLLRTGTRTTLLGNRLVLIAPASSKVRLTPARGFALAKALGTGRLAIADPDAVPAGKYAKAALTALGVWPSVAAKVAPAENVRAAMALVERGAAPLGIVYATDARASKAVRSSAPSPRQAIRRSATRSRC
jgi:molybdate transport system substrate-binding protein